MEEFVFLPLGGTGEIGMNMTLYGYGQKADKKWLMVDCGMTFARDIPGIDLIYPDTAFIEKRRQDLEAIVITHGHEDHIGAIARLWPRLQAPIYTTPFTAALMRSKFIECALPVPDFRLIKPGERRKIGVFDIEFLALTHSIPESNAVILRMPSYTVFHTGDWKIDEKPVVGETIDTGRLEEIGREGVDAMVCDSTNVFVPGVAGNELDVEESMTKLLSGRTGRIAVTTFASNVGRLVGIVRAAHANGRSVALLGRSMERLVGAAKETGFWPEEPELVDRRDAGRFDPDSILFLCTGSQGEPNAALARIARNRHRDVVFERGDQVIFSSRRIPGNEFAIGELQNALTDKGVEIITDSQEFTHVSGHPCRDELLRLYGLLKPSLLVPVHGEPLHLEEHARYARACGVPETLSLRNGDHLCLWPQVKMLGTEQTGRLYQDGRVLIESEDSALAHRRKMAQNGHLSIAVALDERNRLQACPVVKSTGAPYTGLDVDALCIEAEEAIEDLFNTMRRKESKSPRVLESAISRAALRPFSRAWDKRPFTQVMILDV